MNAVDYIIIAITVVFIIIGTYKGLMFSVLSFFGGTVNIYLSMLLTTPLTSLVTKIGITSAISNGYVAKFASCNGFNTALSTIETSNLSNFVTNSINTSNLSGLTKTLTKWFFKPTPEAVAARPEATLSSSLSSAYANFWSTLIAFAISFALITLALWLITKICQKAKENKTVNVIDRIFGFFFGIVRAGIIICLILAIFSVFKPDGVLGDVISYINQSKIGGFIFKYATDFVEKFITTAKIV